VRSPKRRLGAPRFFPRDRANCRHADEIIFRLRLDYSVLDFSGEPLMRLRCAEVMTGFALLVFSGCGDPGQFVPIAPPGANIPKVSPDTAPAQAQGESVPDTGRPSHTVKVAEAHKPAPPTALGETKTTEKGVKYETLREGKGPVLAYGQRSTLDYEGKLASDDKVFDSSRARGKPLSCRIGGDPLIEGWEEGLPGMKVGEIRRLTIPPELAYKERGQPPKIPPNATLIFEVELLSVAPEE
jgi:FKBP-type peptidyl-prolyl cis-trans isomerase